MRMKKALAILTAVCTVTASMCFATVAHAADKTDLVIAVDADIDTLHATNYSTGVEQDVLNQIYDTLGTITRTENMNRNQELLRVMRSAKMVWIILSI